MKDSLGYNIYKKSPVFIQNLFCTAYGYKEKRIRYGKWFDYWSKKIEEIEYYSEGEIEAYQDEKLQELVTLCYQHVPYYKKVFDENNLIPADIKSRDDLYKIPVTTKEDIRKNREEFINTEFSQKDLVKKKTSGTTGKSLSFYSTEEAISFQWAIWWRHRSRFGFRFGDKHLNFTGKPVVPQGQKKPPFWRWNRAVNQGILNMQVLDIENIPHILNFINRNEFDFWVGYPSIIHDFCSKVLENGFTLEYKPKAIFFGAENILEEQKRDIKELTKATLTDQYGLTEGCGNASHCEEFNHHEDFEFGILECLNPEQEDSREKKGRIVCTGFANKAFPFLRYEVGDTGVWASPSFKCSCGRHSSVISRIEGRTDDYVITPEGRKIMRFDYIFKDTDQIREAQVIQNKREEITINIVRRDDYSPETEDNLKDMVHKWISPELSVKFNYLEEIPREQNGKFRAVKSNIQG